MISKLIEFVLLNILVPIIIIPFICQQTGDWFWLFGSVIYFLGVIMAKYKQWVFFPIPLFFCFWFWYTYGFGIKTYVTVYFFCLLLGIFVYRIIGEYKKYVHRVVPENKENMEYQDKLEKMNQMIEKYKKDHPGEKVTEAVMDRIKADVFF